MSYQRNSLDYAANGLTILLAFYNKTYIGIYRKQNLFGVHTLLAFTQALRHNWFILVMIWINKSVWIIWLFLT